MSVALFISLTPGPSRIRHPSAMRVFSGVLLNCQDFLSATFSGDAFAFSVEALEALDSVEALEALREREEAVEALEALREREEAVEALEALREREEALEALDSVEALEALEALRERVEAVEAGASLVGAGGGAVEVALSSNAKSAITCCLTASTPTELLLGLLPSTELLTPVPDEPKLPCPFESEQFASQTIANEKLAVLTVLSVLVLLLFSGVFCNTCSVTFKLPPSTLVEPPIPEGLAPDA
ncbi:hypothetical protein N9Y92_02580 [Chlamydiales bacterium]|nr:hypothetical protein [Chlamydiales bacterium]